jgi:hypothetical protein
MHQWRMLFQWTVLTLFVVAGIDAQEKPAVVFGSKQSRHTASKLSRKRKRRASKRLITLDEAVEIFMRQNLQLVAARYDIETADAEKLPRDSGRIHNSPLACRTSR